MINNSDVYNEELRYTPLKDSEWFTFRELIVALHDTVISMISNVVIVAPNSKSIYSNKFNTKGKYDPLMDIKELIIKCVPNFHNRRDTLNRIIIDITFDQKKKQIDIKSNYKLLALSDQNNALLDIKKIINILNEENDNFNKRLPEAKIKANHLLDRQFGTQNQILARAMQKIRFNKNI